MDSKRKLTTFKIVYYISAATLVFSLVFIILHLGKINPLTHTSDNINNWFYPSFIIPALILVLFIYISKNRFFDSGDGTNEDRDITWQYWVFGICGLLFTFSMVNFTGGLVTSPLTAVYPIFASTVITLFQKKITRLVMIISIIILVIIHFVLTFYSGIIPIIDNQGSFYRSFYFGILILLIILTIYIDWKSR